MVQSGQTVLLFALNAIDAILTLYWVRNGLATEGNSLMATLLNIGDLPFLAVKLSVGALTALALWHYREFRLAKYGVTLALTLYCMIMGAHVITGLLAYGYLGEFQLYKLEGISNIVLSFLV